MMRTEAFRLYRKNWLPLLGMVIIQQGLGFILTALSTALSKWFVLSFAVRTAFSVATYPLALGVTLAYLSLWRHNPIGFSDCIYFYRKDRLMPVLKLGLCIVILQSIWNLPPALLGAILPDIPQSKMILSVVTMVFSIAALWICFRLILVPYLFIDGCNTPITESYRHMGGRVLRAFGFFCSLCLIVVPLVVALMFIAVLTGTDSTVAANGAVNQVALSLMMTLLLPFIGIAMAGYSCYIRQDEPPQYPPHNKLVIKDVYHK